MSTKLGRFGYKGDHKNILFIKRSSLVTQACWFSFQTAPKTEIFCLDFRRRISLVVLVMKGLIKNIFIYKVV